MVSKRSLALLIPAASASILPSDNAFEKRYCGTTIIPSSLYFLRQSNPNNVYPAGNSFQVSQTFNQEAQILLNIQDEYVSFTNIPSGAYGCQLGISFPPNYAFNPQVGSTQLNVYTVAKPVPSVPTYNNAITDHYLFGTIDVTPGQTAVINSRVCPKSQDEGQLAFRLTYHGPIGWLMSTATIGWTEAGSPTTSEGITGIYLSYNC